MQRDVLLVGSVGLATAEDVFRTVASTLGERVKRIPDGETGWARSVWTQCQRPFFMANAALEMVEPDPLTPGAFVPARVPAGGIYAHTMAEAYRGRARLRPGFSAADVRFDNVGLRRLGARVLRDVRTPPVRRRDPETDALSGQHSGSVRSS